MDKCKTKLCVVFTFSWSLFCSLILQLCVVFLFHKLRVQQLTLQFLREGLKKKIEYLMKLIPYDTGHQTIARLFASLDSFYASDPHSGLKKVMYPG